MTRFAESYAVWLADYYLLATVLLALSLTGIAFLKQPAQRLMVTKSTLLALVLLAILCALPGWSVVHLLAANRPAVLAQLPHEEPVAVSEAVARPGPTQGNPVRRPPSPTLDTPTADEDQAKPNTLKMSWPALLAIAHATGMGCIVIWLTLGWIASVRLRHTVHAAPANVSAMMDELASLHSRTSKPLQLFTHDRIDVAVALGVWRPMILLPNEWTSTQSHYRLQAVLAHEATHVLNCDLQWVALARILFVALWANPLFWLTKRRLRLDQEALADAAAAEVTSRQQYAEQLVAWARDARSRPALHLSSAVGLWEGPSQLRQRIAILLDEQLTVLRNCSRRWRIGSTILALGVAALLSLATTRPAVIFAENTTVQPAATKETKVEEKQEEDVTLSGIYQAGAPAGVPNNIAGQCVDEAGKPLAGVEVLLARATWDGTSRQDVAKQTTGADGRFHFDNVVDIKREYPDGKIPKFSKPNVDTFQIITRKPGRESYSELLYQDVVAGYGAKIQIVMGPAATLRGRITNPQGEPVSGALVSVGFSQFDRWEGFQTARTKVDGTYEITDAPTLKVPAKKEGPPKELQAGTYSLVTRAANQPISVTQTDYADRLVRCKGIPGTQDIQLKPAAVIRGRVIDAATNKPIAKARVFVMPSVVKRNPDNDANVAFTKADTNGEYQIRTLPAGVYNLWASGPDRVNQGIKNLKSSTDAETTAPDLVLTTGGTLRIRLIDDKTGEPVRVHNGDAAQILVEPFVPYSPTGNATAQSGRFEVRVVPGDVKVSSVVASPNDALTWFIRPGDSVAAHVNEGQTVDVDVRVQKYDADQEQHVQALFARAIAAQRANDDGKALAEYDKIIKLDPTFPHNVAAYYVAAHLLAMSADDTVRDGKRAVEYAQKAIQLQPKPDPQLLDTLAAAFAESGDFAKAIETQKKAIELAAKNNEEKSLLAPLKLYEAHKPRRESKQKPASKANGKLGARLESNTVTGRAVDEKDQPVAGASTAEPNATDRSAPSKPPAKSVAANTPAKSDENLQTALWWPTKWPLPNTIRGYAVDENSQPIAGAEAFLFRINRVDGSRKLQAKTKTDAQGKYAFANVIDIAKEFPDGKLEPNNPLEEEFVQVYLRAPGRVAEMQMDLRQRIASTGKFYSIKLPPAATLTGRVTGPDGKPVSGALVSVGNSGFTTWEGAASARTKDDGTYIIDDVPPYGIEEYRKKAADENRRMEALAATKSQDTYALFVAPPMMTVAHPDFATKTAIYNKIPGEQDVQLEPAAIIEGRVVLGDSNKPAGGVIVKLNTSPPKEASSNEDYFVPNPFAAQVRTDGDGKYQFASLPAGNYDLSAEKSNWVNQGIDAFAAASGKTLTAPNLTLTPGGIISIRLIDDKTGKSIPIKPDTRADISAHRFPLITKGITRPAWKPNAEANAVGRFELHAPPGKRAVFVGLVHEGEQTKWINKQSRTLDPKVVDVVEGKTVEVDVPVIEMPKDPAAAITGKFRAISPVKVPDEQPKKKSSAEGAAKKPDKNDGANLLAPGATAGSPSSVLLSPCLAAQTFDPRVNPQLLATKNLKRFL